MPTTVNWPRRFVATLCMIVPAWTGSANIDEDWVGALTRRDLDVIERLLPERARANANLAAEDGRTALMLAAGQARADIVRDLLKAGAAINQTNSRGGTALMYGAVTGDLPTMKTLLANGASVDARASNGWTAMMIASVKGYVELVDLLLDSGADPNISDVYGWTPLMRATHENRAAVVDILLQNQRTNVNAKDEHGDTALHHAAVRGYVDIARELIAHGADVGSVDSAGRTPLAIASAQGHQKLAQILRRAGH